MILPKYFTPPISDEDRKKLYTYFGLNSLSYLFTEKFKEKVFRRIRIDGINFKLTKITETQPELVFYSSTYTIPRKSLCEEQSLWEELFLYPLNRIGECFKSKDLCFESTPTEIKEGLCDLWHTIVQFEEKLRLFELTILQFNGIKNGDFSLLFQYVRGKRVRIGNMEYLDAYWKKYFCEERCFSCLSSVSVAEFPPCESSNNVLNSIQNLVSAFKTIALIHR